MNIIKLINFTKLSVLEKKIILKWRNNNNIKRYMYNTNIIQLKNHLKFITRLKKSKDNLYYLLKYNNQYLGVIYFTQINKYKKETTFGLYSNMQVKGNGTIILKTIINYAFNTLNISSLQAEVFKNNTSALYLYKKFNFKRQFNKFKKNNYIINMELKYENR